MLDRKSPPPHIQSTSFELIRPDHIALENGIEIFFVTGGSQDVLKIELVFDAGRWFETQWGAAQFMSNLLSKGTRHKSSFQIAEIFDRYGAHLEVSPSLDVVSISLYSLTKNLAPVFALLEEILTEPSFDEKEVQQAKAIFSDNLQVNLEKTSYLASKLFKRNLFGESHPYGKELEEHDVVQLSTHHLQNHFSNFFHNTRIFVSGKIDAGNKSLIQKSASRWKNKKNQPARSFAPQVSSGNQYQEKEGSVQSSMRFGKRFILRDHPDYQKTIFVAHILGGYFGSRLMKNIREEKGFTYGIYASIHALRHGSYLAIGADVNKENLSATYQEIRKELQRLCHEKITSGELETARNHFIGSLQSEITTPFAHADKIKTIQLFNLPASYYQKLVDTISNITPLDIMEISNQYFEESSFCEVAVG